MTADRASLVVPTDSYLSGLLEPSVSRLEALVLLVGAGMFIQSLNKLRNIDLKLNSTNRYIVHFNPQAAGYSPVQVEALYRTIEERFHAIPGLQKIGISSNTPMEANNSGDGVQIQGQPYLNDGASWVRGNAEYFDSVGTHVLMGRGFTTQDTSTSPAVAVVNQSFVKKFFKPGENPIGRRFGLPGTQSSGDFEIVGVVEDTAYSSVTWKNHKMYFLPMTQRIPESARQYPLKRTRPSTPVPSSSRPAGPWITCSLSPARPSLPSIRTSQLSNSRPSTSRSPTASLRTA
jgi:macrolide transport system ATP-binding/permease protein